MIALDSAEERQAAAGEYVLGTLNDADREAFMSAMAGDASLQAEVYAWQDRLLGLSVRAPAAEPRPQLWQRIAVALNATAATAQQRREPAARLRWWQRTAPWQGIGGIALAALLVLIATPLLRPWLSAPAHPHYLAVLQSPQDRSTGWIVDIEAGRPLHLVPLAGAAAPPEGRSLQFWTKPEGAAGPTSLGLVKAGEKTERALSQLPALGEQQLFEITLEPANGSPTSKPSGPVLYVGRTIRL